MSCRWRKKNNSKTANSCRGPQFPFSRQRGGHHAEGKWRGCTILTSELNCPWCCSTQHFSLFPYLVSGSCVPLAGLGQLQEFPSRVALSKQLFYPHISEHRKPQAQLGALT